MPLANAHAEGFTRGTLWNGYFAVNAEVPAVGDFNGDRLDDVVTFIRSTQSGSAEGDVYVALSNGEQFSGSSLWKGWFAPGQEVPKVGDFNGDGRKDIVTFTQSTQTGTAAGDVWVALSNGSSFGSSSVWHDFFSPTGELPMTGDFNGDGRDDIVTFVRSSQTSSAMGDVWVALSNGSRFNAASVWHTYFAVGNEVPMVGDFNGDGRDDIVTFLKSTQTGANEGDVYVALANTSGTGFGASSIWDSWFSPGAEVPAVGDVNGDGRDDIITFVKSTQSGVSRSDVWVALSNGSSFGELLHWQEAFGLGDEVVMSGKFNRDAKADIIDFYRSTYSDGRAGDVYVGLSSVEGAQPTTATLSDFGYRGMRSDTANRDSTGTRPLLVILMNETNPDDAEEWVHCQSTNAACRAYYSDYFFGSDHPNIPGFFSQNSYGAFTFSRAGVVGPYNYPTPKQSNRTITFNEAIHAASASVSFDSYDRNNDGYVRADELTILVIDNRSTVKGMGGESFTRPPGSSVYVITDCAAAGEETSLTLAAHELAHTLGTQDLYGEDGLSNERLTLMAGSLSRDDMRSFHLDPWHKMRLGWIEPAIYSIRETQNSLTIPAAHRSNAQDEGFVILYDPRRGTHEYFMLEYRTPVEDPAFPYDSFVNGFGIALWHIRTESSHEAFMDGNEPSVRVLNAPDFAPGKNNLWRESHGRFRPSWDDGTGAGIVLSTSAADQTWLSTNVDWAWIGPASPNLESHPPAVARGQNMYVFGDFDAAQRGKPVVVFDPNSVDRPGSRREFNLTVEQWTADWLRVRVPTTTPTGNYQMRIYSDSTRRIHGTWVPFTVQ